MMVRHTNDDQTDTDSGQIQTDTMCRQTLMMFRQTLAIFRQTLIMVRQTLTMVRQKLIQTCRVQRSAGTEQARGQRATLHQRHNKGDHTRCRATPMAYQHSHWPPTRCSLCCWPPCWSSTATDHPDPDIAHHWAVQAGLLTRLTFARRRLSPLAAFTSGAYFFHNGGDDSEFENFTLPKSACVYRMLVL